MQAEKRGGVPARPVLALGEYHRFVLVDEHAVFQVPAHGAREYDLLQVATLAHHVLDGVAVRHAYRVLLDDGPLVQSGGDVMTGGSDDFDSALKRPMIRLGPNKSRQKRMMDVDQPEQIVADEFGAEYLHVAGEHDEVNILAQQFGNLTFGFGLVQRITQQVERNSVELDQASHCGIAANHVDDVALQFTAALPVEQICQAMVKRGNQDRDLGAVAAQGEVVLDLIAAGHRPEVPFEIGHGNVELLQVPLHAREVEFAAAVNVVVGMKYVAVVSDQKLRDGSQHALAGERDGTAGEKHGCVLHWLATCPERQLTCGRPGNECSPQ